MWSHLFAAALGAVVGFVVAHRYLPRLKAWWDGFTLPKF